MRVNAHSLSLVLVGCLAAWPALAQAPAESPVQPVGILGAPSGTGGSPAVAESDATLRTHVLYHPRGLSRARACRSSFGAMARAPTTAWAMPRSSARSRRTAIS